MKDKVREESRRSGILIIAIFRFPCFFGEMFGLRPVNVSERHDYLFVHKQVAEKSSECVETLSMIGKSSTISNPLRSS
jgi:hypothetical protein